MNSVSVAFPRHSPFTQFDFFPQPSFLSVDGVPVALFSHAGVLVSYQNGSAELVPKSVLKQDNHEGLCWREFAELVGKSARDYRPARQPSAAKKTPPKAAQTPTQPKEIDITPYLDHPLNKAALALLKKHKKGGRAMPAVLPVLELCFSTMTQEEVESPKGMSVILASFRDPAEVLRYIEENMSPAELIEVDDLEVAGDMVLRRVMKLEFADMPEFRAWDFY
jgi:hypothetical protein